MYLYRVNDTKAYTLSFTFTGCRLVVLIYDSQGMLVAGGEYDLGSNAGQ